MILVLLLLLVTSVARVGMSMASVMRSSIQPTERSTCTSITAMARVATMRRMMIAVCEPVVILVLVLILLVFLVSSNHVGGERPADGSKSTMASFVAKERAGRTSEEGLAKATLTVGTLWACYTRFGICARTGISRLARLWIGRVIALVLVARLWRSAISPLLWRSTTVSSLRRSLIAILRLWRSGSIVVWLRRPTVLRRSAIALIFLG